MNNEEIIKEMIDNINIFNVGEKMNVTILKLMNLARADEKKKSNSGNFSVKGNYTFNQLINRYDTLAKELNKRLRISYSQGFDKGCLETERKIINKLIAIHQMGDDNLLRYIQEWLQSRELESEK